MAKIVFAGITSQCCPTTIGTLDRGIDRLTGSCLHEDLLEKFQCTLSFEFKLFACHTLAHSNHILFRRLTIVASVVTSLPSVF